MNLMLVCKSSKEVVEKALQDGWVLRSFEKYMNQKLPEISFDDLSSRLRISKAVISGSTIVQWALGEDYKSDIDIFYTREYADQIRSRPFADSIQDVFSLWFYTKLVASGTNPAVYTHSGRSRVIDNYEFLLDQYTDSYRDLTLNGAIQFGTRDTNRELLPQRIRVFLHNFTTEHCKLQLVEMKPGSERQNFKFVETQYDTVINGRTTNEGQSLATRMVLNTFDFEMLRCTYDGDSLRIQRFSEVNKKLLTRCSNMFHSSDKRLEKYLSRGFRLPERESLKRPVLCTSEESAKKKCTE